MDCPRGARAKPILFGNPAPAGSFERMIESWFYKPQATAPPEPSWHEPQWAITNISSG